jgi:hypothetical protein
VDLLVELPLLVSATVVSRSLSHLTDIGDSDDSGILSAEFAH